MCSVTEIGYQSFGYKYTMIGVRVMTSYECGYVISGQLHLYRYMCTKQQGKLLRDTIFSSFVYSKTLYQVEAFKTLWSNLLD